MFTGIIREIGIISRVKRGSPWSLTIKAPKLAPAIRRGDSISVSGVCLTATNTVQDSFDVDVSTETLKRSILTGVRTGMKVNLEPAIGLQTALDGHIVQGHVDGTGRIVRISGGRTQKEFLIRPLENPGALIVEKGSVAVNGISLTVSGILAGGEFTVMVIPLTLMETDMQFCTAGDSVNLEYDIIGKYVDGWLKNRHWRVNDK